MNAQNYTQKSLDAVRTAQSMAQENRNSTIAPEHLLYALVDQDGGLIPSLLGKMGVDCNVLLSELDTAIAALPKVGNPGEVYLSPEADRVIRAAETPSLFIAIAKIRGSGFRIPTPSDIICVSIYSEIPYSIRICGTSEVEMIFETIPIRIPIRCNRSIVSLSLGFLMFSTRS